MSGVAVRRTWLKSSCVMCQWAYILVNNSATLYGKWYTGTSFNVYGVTPYTVGGGRWVSCMCYGNPILAFLTPWNTLIIYCSYMFLHFQCLCFLNKLTMTMWWRQYDVGGVVDRCMKTHAWKRKIQLQCCTTTESSTFSMFNFLLHVCSFYLCLSFCIFVTNKQGSVLFTNQWARAHLLAYFSSAIHFYSSFYSVLS